MLLSIDVGIKNLAMCVMDQKKIKYWDVSGVPPLHQDGLFPCMKRHMDERLEFFTEVQQVIIEKQPDKNKGIKSVEHFLHAYFLCHDKNVTIWDARHKIPDVVGPGRTQYALRKKTSIDRCRLFLEEENPEWLEQFDQSKKKDDLADTVMQALSYRPAEPETKKSNPRKPTENQTRTKYSRANLAWIVKNNGKQDARFQKDLARYYRNIDELLQEFNLTQEYGS
jgi:Poxvirus A22 protein